MLRTNLSTRPFYNERVVHLLLGLAALFVIVLTAFNVIRIISLSRQNTDFSALINRDRNEAQRLTREAQQIRAGINQEELQVTAKAAEEANRLIDQRTFSWTEFFNRIEATLPSDVMLTAVQPSFDAHSSVVQIWVLGKRTEDIDQFIEKLEGTGAFLDVLPAQEDRMEDGLHRVLLRAVYSQTADARPSASAPFEAATGGRGEALTAQPGPADEREEAQPVATPEPAARVEETDGVVPQRGRRGSER